MDHLSPIVDLMQIDVALVPDGWKPFAVPTSERTILDCFAEVLRHAPQWPAVVDGQHTITFAEQACLINRQGSISTFVHGP